MGQGADVAWIGLDWGTSHLRAWALSATGATLGYRHSDAGMGGLAPDRFEPALLDLIADWLSEEAMLVLACGMVGARQGWVEAAYGHLPSSPLSLPFTAAPVKDPRLNVHIVPGLSQDTPADVMRGEETQIAGFLADRPSFSGWLCLPGTHSKWAQVETGTVLRFRTFMSGELFALLSRHSILRHSVAESGWDGQGFARGVEEALDAPHALTGTLFSLRAESLLQGTDPAVARARLSGLLVGTEIAAMRGETGVGPVGLIGDNELTGLYARALAAAGLPVDAADGDETVLAGLMAARRLMKEHSQ